MPAPFARVFVELKEHGLLLLTDAHLPNVCALVAGETVRGSWWAHPRAQAILGVDGALADHPDVLMIKLVSGKVTYVHRALWASVIAVGRAREPWQMKELSRDARKLLAESDRGPVEPGRAMSKAASEPESRLLVYSAQFHSESGAQVRRLESWDQWVRTTSDVGEPVTPAQGRRAIEEAITDLNRAFDGKGRLPWQGKTA